MKDNGYVALLDHDTLKMRHPTNSSKIVTLYRIIATKSFDLPKFGIHVERYDIGGFVESLDNLDINNPVWIANNARIFDQAKILNGSLIRNMALVYENCTVTNSVVSNNCRIHGSCIIDDSIIKDLVEVKDTANVTSTMLSKSSKIYKNAKIINSRFSIGASAHGDCQVINSEINDISEIRGTAIINNCKYYGRVIRESGEYLNETLDKELNLTMYEEVDESTHKEYNI